MYYAIRHVTRFLYSSPIAESVMEVFKQPRTEGRQRCLSFTLTVKPRARVQSYVDYLGNHVHSFDIPGKHSRLDIIGEALVEIEPFEPLPDALDPSAWAALDALIHEADYWEMLIPSRFVEQTDLLEQIAAELNVTERRDDPLTLLRQINKGLYDAIDYKPQSTQVDSSIDEALSCRCGVCQDYAHIMLSLLRPLRIPARYVSGYLFHQKEKRDRSEQDATHAWVEALLPGLGWVGFDPTNNLIAGERHIRTAVGRDYADVPPTRGVFKGSAETELQVAVAVNPTEKPPTDDDLEPIPAHWLELEQQHQQSILMQEQQQQQ